MIQRRTISSCVATIYTIALVELTEKALVHIEYSGLRGCLPQLLVAVDQAEPHDPDREHRHGRETDTRHPRLQEPGVIGRWPQIRRVYTGQISQRVTQRQRHSLLLGRLAESYTSPTQHDVVDTERKGNEDEDSDETGGDVCCDGRDDEADDDDAFADGDVPGTLVVASGCVRHDDGHGCGE